MDNFRPVLYLFLLFTLFLVWQAWQRDYGPQPVAPTAHERAVLGDEASPPRDIPDAPISEARDAPQTPLASMEPERPRIRVVTDVLDILIDPRGGDLVQADLPTYPVSLNTPDIPVRLLDERIRRYIAQSGLIHDRVPGTDGEGRAPSHHAMYSFEQAEYRLNGADELTVPLTWTGPDGIQVIKTYTFRRGDFLIDVSHEVINDSQDPWIGRQYRQIRHGSTPDRESWFLYTFTGGAYFDTRYEKISLEEMASKPVDQDVQGGWISLIQHYFLTAWIPDESELNMFYTRGVGTPTRPEYIIGMRSEPLVINPGYADTFSTQFWVGPKLQDRLSEVTHGLELTVDYGIFTFLAKPLFWLLKTIYSFVGNWGWAIIILTIMIKLVFYHLSAASYRSMAKMRAVHPKMMALKQRYADDKQRLNQAMMELYKKEKINPLGGCLPILVQIPVFIALYWTLLESVELRQAPWIFWIQDLSTRDPYFVLPLLMGISMIVQHKLNPPPMDPIQQKIMLALPIIFTVFFAFFPAGLVLYWFVNNLLSIGQQWMITRQIEKAAESGGSAKGGKKS
ncbi:membrane protein insertase YidC [Thiorhodospira sibirica]|uniref:membrane protein insertase YidC n=1 Tax=Thiorhodospira sibirica TaxID=154347 RepID=UPI00022C39DE|nr:membrane protein insertase YidC [Thiorhodospira sibirica]